MSPDQLHSLQHLSRLFEEGQAGPKQIIELSELLATINHNVNAPDYESQEQVVGFKSDLPLR